MERLIEQLESKVLFKDNEFANEYLSYNTTWSMIKRNRVLLNINPVTRIVFEDLVIISKFEQHYSDAFRIVSRKIEHYIKVNISRRYQNLNTTLREETDKQILEIWDLQKYKKLRSQLSSNDIFEIINNLYYSELVKINNELDKTATISGITNICRNAASHHDSLLIATRKINKSNTKRR